MNWTVFFQSVVFVTLGAHIYSCGKAGQSLIHPVHTAIARLGEIMSRRNGDHERENQNISPNLRS